MVTREYVYDILYSAKEAHMNMLRVWGGKESIMDIFYCIDLHNTIVPTELSTTLPFIYMFYIFRRYI